MAMPPIPAMLDREEVSPPMWLSQSRHWTLAVKLAVINHVSYNYGMFIILCLVPMSCWWPTLLLLHQLHQLPQYLLLSRPLRRHRLSPALTTQTSKSRIRKRKLALGWCSGSRVRRSIVKRYQFVPRVQFHVDYAVQIVIPSNLSSIIKRKRRRKSAIGLEKETGAEWENIVKRIKLRRDVPKVVTTAPIKCQLPHLIIEHETSSQDSL